MSATVAGSPPHISEWKVVKGGLVVAVGLMAGQALGFVRHAFIAYLLGTGSRADAISVAFVPVDLLWAVLSTAVVFGFGPMLAANSQRQAGPCFVKLARLLVRPVFVFTLAMILLAAPAVKILAPGLSREAAEAAIALLRATSLAIPALAGSALFTALLYSERRFGVPAFHQSVVNIATITAAALFAARFGPMAIALGFVAGAWIQLGAVWWNARDLVRRQTEPAGSLDWWFLLREPLPVLVYSVLVGMNAVVARAFASTFGVGATAGFDYSLRLLGVPLALLVVPLSSSMLSEIARFRLLHKPGAALRAIGKAAALTGGLAALVTVFVAAFGPRIVSLLFERGSFTSISTSTVSAILSGFFPSLIAWSVMDILSRSLFSLGRNNVPLVAAGTGLLLNTTLCAEARINSISGIGYGSIAGFTTGALIVAIYLWRLGVTEAGRRLNS